MRITYILIALSFLACSEMKKPTNMPSVKASVETEAVSANIEDDAADDPAIWFNTEKPYKSLVIGSNKTKGIDVYSLEGKLIGSYDVGRINNVDVRNMVQFQDTILDLVGGSNRSTKTLDFWSVDAATLELRSLGTIPSGLPDVYGFCLYKDPSSGKGYALINSKTGKVEQWELVLIGDEISGELKRTLQLPGQVEGMVADDDLGKLYVGVEEGGIYRFDASATGSAEGILLENSGESNSNIKYDVEGLTIYSTNNREGYLIASSQGNNSYAVFERSDENKYLGSYIIVDGNVDGVEETDGIDATHLNLGDSFPKGVFICQDGYNFDGDKKVSQNFKLVDWREIERVVEGF
jgi:3-phytase